MSGNGRTVVITYIAGALFFGFAWEAAMALITDRGFSVLEAFWVGAAWGVLFFLTNRALERFRRRREPET